MEHTTDDLELLLTKPLRNILRPLWNGLYVSRALSEETPTHAVTIQYAGGNTKGPRRFQDQARFAVNVYAPTHQEANQLAGDTRAAILSLARGHRPIIDTDASVYSDVTPDGEAPQRYFYADITYRRSLP